MRKKFLSDWKIFSSNDNQSTIIGKNMLSNINRSTLFEQSVNFAKQELQQVLSCLAHIASIPAKKKALMEDKLPGTKNVPGF